jgi:putative transposase
VGGVFEKRRILISMDGKENLKPGPDLGLAIDKVYIERLWRTVKYDYIYISPPEDGWQPYQGLKGYNHQKHHQGSERKLLVSLYYSSWASLPEEKF